MAENAKVAAKLREEVRIKAAQEAAQKAAIEAARPQEEKDQEMRIQIEGQRSAASVFLSLFLLVIGSFAYFFPVVIALSRQHPDATAIVLIQLFFCWLPCISWPIALIWAVKSLPQPVQVVIGHRDHDDE